MVSLRRFSSHGSSASGPAQPRQPGYPADIKSSSVCQSTGQASFGWSGHQTTSIEGSVSEHSQRSRFSIPCRIRRTCSTVSRYAGKTKRAGCLSPIKILRLCTSSLSHSGPSMTIASSRNTVREISRTAGHLGSVIRMFCSKSWQVLKDGLHDLGAWASSTVGLHAPFFDSRIQKKLTSGRFASSVSWLPRPWGVPRSAFSTNRENPYL